MMEGTAFRFAAALKATDASDPSYPSAIRNFLEAMFPVFREDGIDVLYRLRAIDLDQMAIALAGADEVRQWMLSLVGQASTADRCDPDWLLALGLSGNLGFALALAPHRPRANVEKFAIWMGCCEVFEAGFDPSSWMSIEDESWQRAADGLKTALAKCLAECGQGGARALIAGDAVRFIKARPVLQYLLHLGHRDLSIAVNASTPLPVADLAALACTPLERLPGLAGLLSNDDLRPLMLEKFEAQDYCPDRQDDIDADLRARQELASVILAELDTPFTAVDPDLVLRTLGLSAPRGFSSSLDYRELQRLRAKGYDLIARQRYEAVDGPLDAAVPGSVALLMSTLFPSAETHAALMYARALEAAGFRTRIIVWPHNFGQGADDGVINAAFEVVDLRFVSFKDRVAVVRSLRLQVLFLMNNATWGWSEYIAACCHRLATIQIATYLSPVTLGFCNIDYFLVGTESEGPRADERYLEKTLQIDGSVLCFGRSSGVVGDARPTNAKPVGACGASLPKLNPDALATMFALASEAGLAELIFYPFNPSWGIPPNDILRLYLARQARRAGFEGVVTVLGPFTDQDEVRQLLRRCDLYIDSFPHSGGLSVLDAIECGVPVVYRSGCAQRSLQARNVVDATGAAGLDLARHSHTTVGDLVAAGRRLPPMQAPHALFEPAMFGRLVADALDRLGVTARPPTAAFAFRSVGTMMTLRTQGRRLTYVDRDLSKPHPLPIIGAGAFWLSLMPAFEGQFPRRSGTFRSGVGRVVIDTPRDQSMVFLVDCQNAESGEQLRMVSGHEASGWTNPLLPGANPAVSLSCNLHQGSNVVDIVSSLENSRIMLGRSIRVAALGSPNRAEYKARWRSLEGFSFWEGAMPTLGLDAAFRWCVGSSSRLLVRVDKSGVVGLRMEIKVAAPDYKIAVKCKEGLPPWIFHRTAGSFDDIEVLTLNVELKEGDCEIALEPTVAKVSEDRHITMILRDVTLLTKNHAA